MFENYIHSVLLKPKKRKFRYIIGFRIICFLLVYNIFYEISCQIFEFSSLYKICNNSDLNNETILFNQWSFAFSFCQIYFDLWALEQFTNWILADNGTSSHDQHTLDRSNRTYTSTGKQKLQGTRNNKIKSRKNTIDSNPWSDMIRSISNDPCSNESNVTANSLTHMQPQTLQQAQATKPIPYYQKVPFLMNRNSNFNQFNEENNLSNNQDNDNNDDDEDDDDDVNDQMQDDQEP